MTILLLESLHPQATERLQAAGRVILAEDPAEAVEVARAEKVEAIITRGRGQVRAPLLDASPKLRLVARAGVGLDNVDVAGATERGVRVINAPGSTTIAVAEQTMMLMSAMVRGLYPSAHAVKRGDWESRRGYRGDDLAGKRLGLVGMGEIAQRVARLAEAYDMEIAHWNRSDRDVPYPRRSLPELLASSDVVSLHVALTPATRHLVGAEQLATMPEGSYLVNTARGAIIDQAALLPALDSGHLAGFATDVLDPEPPAEGDPILSHPRTLITPHTAALTDSTYRRICTRTAGNVVALLTGNSPEPGCIFNERELAAGSVARS